MRAAMRCAPLLLALLTACLFAPACGGKVKGMAFSSGHDLEGYRKWYADVSLRNLKKTGTKYVHITAILGMVNINSVTSYEVTDDESLRYIIRKCKRMGFKIFLKPIVQTKYFRWRGFVSFPDVLSRQRSFARRRRAGY